MILVGEMRDLETISTALTAAETGHLVFATLHTQDTAQTVDRIVDVFPPTQQQQVRVQLSVALQGIVTQQLLPTADGMGRCCAAETGHLVFATLHTQDTAQTVDRIVDVFPPSQQQQVRVQLSVALQGIVTQQLLPTADGMARVCATEVLVPTPAVRNLIREGKTHQIYSALQTGGSHGMQTMDAALADLVRRNKITRELAEARASAPEELRRLMGTVRVA